jgi:CheY-like chemotaxis protein
MDWYEMCQLLTSNPATAPLPVITLTRESEAYIALRAIHAGACDCISYDMFVVRNLVEALRNLNVL